jgi:hypothetical protein
MVGYEMCSHLTGRGLVVASYETDVKYIVWNQGFLSRIKNPTSGLRMRLVLQLHYNIINITLIVTVFFSIQCSPVSTNSVHIQSDVPDSVHIQSDVPESVHIQSDVPDSAHIQSDVRNRKYSQRCHIYIYIYILAYFYLHLQSRPKQGFTCPSLTAH